jgi:hypothetical protein
MFTFKPAFTQANLRQADNGNQSPWKTQLRGLIGGLTLWQFFKHHGHSVNSHMVSMDFHWNGYVLPCPIWTDDPNFHFFQISWTSPEMPGDCIANTSWLANSSEWVNLKPLRDLWEKTRAFLNMTPSRVGGQNRQFQDVSTMARGTTGNSPIFSPCWHVFLISRSKFYSKSCHFVSLKIPCFMVNSM